MPLICEVCGVSYPEQAPAPEGEGRLCLKCRGASPETVFVSAPAPADAAPTGEKAPRISLLPGFEKDCRRSYAAGGRGMLWMGLAAVLSAAVFGSVYAGFQFYRPVLLAFLGRLADPLNFIPIGACALAQGWLIGKAGILGGTRHNGVLIAFGFLGGLLTLYWSWALYLRLLGGGAWALSPFELLGAVNALAAAHPPWSTGLISLESGYKIVWALEALMIAGGAAFHPALIAHGPWCERCRRALSMERRFVDLWGIPGPAKFSARVREGDLSPFLELKLLPGKPERFFMVRFWKCPACQVLHAVSVAASERSGGSIGAETPLIEGLTLDWEAYEWLLKRLLSLRSG